MVVSVSAALVTTEDEVGCVVETAGDGSRASSRRTGVRGCVRHRDKRSSSRAMPAAYRSVHSCPESRQRRTRGGATAKSHCGHAG